MSWDSLQDAPMNHYLLHGDGNHSKVKLLSHKRWPSNYFSLREILHHVKLDYKKHCSVPLLSYVLTHDEPTLTNTVCTCALDCLSLHAIQTKQGGYECYHVPTCQVITQPYVTVVPVTPAIIATIKTLGKSDGIQNLKITNLCGHLLFDSSVDLALLAGVDDTDDKDTSFGGVPVPNAPITMNTDNNSDAESDHNSVDPNEADDTSSKASIHSSRSQLSVHSATSEPPQHPPDDKDNLSEDQTEPDNIELPKLETELPVLHQSERVSVPPSNYIPQMGGKTYVMNVQTETQQDEENGLV